MKIAYFPLRSSVELFKDPTSPQPVSRAKYAAILYDTVVFEVGLFEQTIGKTGASGIYVPPGMADDERRKRARIVHEAGSTFQLAVGAQSAFGVPAPPETMRTVINTEIDVTYAAEWHTGVIDDLETLKPDWAAPIDSNQLLAEDEVLKDEERKLKWSLKQSVDAADNSFHKDFLIDAFSRDATVAAALGAAVQVTSLFRPLLPGLPDMTADHPGLLSLSVAVPGMDQLSWEEISEFREHAGSEEARGRLRDAEERVAADTISDPTAFALRVGQEISADLLAAMVEVEGSLPKKLVKDGVNAGISLIPFVGSFASGVSAAETLAEAAKRKRTWHAALMTLRKATGDR